MGFKREEIRDWSALSLKKLNDNIRNLWMHSFGNIDFADLSKSTQKIINSKVGDTTFTQEIDSINGAMATKASSNTVNSISGRLTTAESTITQQAGQIATKVDVNGVKSTITQSASEVQVAFNGITGNVQNSSGKFSIINGAIEVKNNSNVVTIDGNKMILRIVKSGNGNLSCASGQNYADITIPHNLGYTPSIYGNMLDNGSPAKSKPMPHVDYDWSSLSNYHATDVVMDMNADSSNLYIFLYRSNAHVNSGSLTYYYRYYIFDESAF